MDLIKDAFSKVKKDIELLNQDRFFLNSEIREIKESLEKINRKLDYFVLNKRSSIPTQNIQKTMNQQIVSTHNPVIEPLKPQILGISKGNQGVPTDRQTDRQTDNSTQNEAKFHKKEDTKTSESSISNAIEILESLDNIKKELRLKFKRLTDQELLVFSTIYQLDEEQGYSDHKILSEKLNLSESSIRDYIGRLIRKGIPIEKTKINNKSIHLSISKNLKKIATLSTILHLRDL